jgi:hypothetical protein
MMTSNIYLNERNPCPQNRQRFNDKSPIFHCSLTYFILFILVHINELNQ